MKHLFVPPELSVIAKSKGFNLPCFGYYDLAKDSMELRWVKRQEFHLNSEWSSVSAPLYQQIIQWLFNKGFYLEDQWLSIEGLWVCDLRDLKGDIIWEDSIDNKSLEIQDAWNRAIAKALHFLP